MIREYTNTLIEQTRSRPQEVLEVKLNMQMDKFPVSLPLNFYEEGSWLSALKRFEVTNTIFKTTDVNKTFSISTLGYW